MHPDTTSFFRNSGRAVGGALVFSLPMLMTQEMWWLGYAIDPLRLALFVVLSIPMLTALSHYIGFENTSCWRDSGFDALFAIGVGILLSSVVLVAVGMLKPGQSWNASIGQVAIQVVPASIGAVLARGQFGMSPIEDRRAQSAPYVGEIFLMAVGAVFLGFNIAPTDEMVMLSARMTSWHAIALVLLSLAVMHGFVFAVGFRGGTQLSAEEPWWSAFTRFTLPGYVAALLISLYVLWTFGRVDGASFSHTCMAVVVLGFPSSLGAAAARLII